MLVGSRLYIRRFLQVFKSRAHEDRRSKGKLLGHILRAAQVLNLPKIVYGNWKPLLRSLETMVIATILSLNFLQAMGPASVYSAFVADFDSHMKRTITSTRVFTQSSQKAPSRDQHYRPYNRCEFSTPQINFYLFSYVDSTSVAEFLPRWLQYHL